MKPITSYTRALAPEQGELLRELLRARGFLLGEAPHARFAAEKEKLKIVLYDSGKLVVQGRGTEDFVQFILEPEVLGRAELGYEEVLNPDQQAPRLGVDESGKGDLFGPLCVAGVYVNPGVLAAWKGTGIRDSKTIGSDRRIGELAKVIRSTPGCVFTVVPIGNEAYNRLHARMRTVNELLAWGHARVIENLLGQSHRMDPAPVRAVIDQFAASPRTVERALMASGRALTLVQRHKAESDPAVAAASILARDEFVRRLARLSEEYGVELPKGASSAADGAAREFIGRHGREMLGKVAKVHFSNIKRIMDLHA